MYANNKNIDILKANSIIKSESTSNDEPYTEYQSVVDTSVFWNIIDFKKNWRDNLTINLTRKEAIFLKNKIISSCNGTLLSFILESEDNDFLLINKFNELDALKHRFPQDILEDYILAKKFANFIQGIHIRYNVILSNKLNDDVNSKWREWYLNVDEYINLDLNYILGKKLNINNRSLLNFLLDTQKSLAKQALDDFDNILIQREVNLKGQSRAKLNNINEYEYKDWVGIDKLQYRFINAKNIISDIFEGLGGEDA